MPKQIPVANELTRPFWDAVNEKRLVVQHCKSCNRNQYPPEAVCAQCESAQNLEWKEVKGQGHIIGYIVIHDSRIRRIQADQPLNMAVVSLDEDPHLNFLSHLPGTPVDQVPVGDPVQLIFEEVAPGQLIHEWKVV